MRNKVRLLWVTESPVYINSRKIVTDESIKGNTVN
jgi:hypothetical protein